MRIKLIDKIINIGIFSIAIMSIPLNIITFFALNKSEYFLPRLIPPLFSLFVIILAIFSKKIKFEYKAWSFVWIIFFTGCFTLLLGLIDMASLWFILSLIYLLLITNKAKVLSIFTIEIVLVILTGVLMINKNTFIPLDYKFQSCQFACVVIRIINFLFIGFHVFFILNVFFSTIKRNISDLEKKSNDLENLNNLLKNEINEKQLLQQNLIESVILTEEKERKRIATDLHDGLGPVLSAIKLYFQAFNNTNNINSKEEIGLKLEKIIDNTINDISVISQNISPPILENYGLISALENFINQIKINKNIKFDFTFDNIKRFELKNELTLYRTITELINNTLKHSNGNEIFLKISDLENYLFVKYTDNGMGFSIDNALKSKSGMGLNNISNRIKSLNGSFLLSSAPNSGLLVEIKIPYIKIFKDEKN